MDDSHLAIPEPELRARLGAASVAIVGCGGLGSNVASMLVRAGVKSFTLIDFDRVEESNLNRQLFFQDQLGMKKAAALSDTLGRIHSGLQLRLVHSEVTADTLLELVRDHDVIVEAVDRPEVKAMIVETCARELPETPVVTASGLAGYDSANLIETERLADNVWIVGDLAADVREGHPLIASRVMVAAAHQAHAVVRILLGLSEP
jgi:sulfur carrier protein ThiS adenylyltransferase